jgi:hypothetical protein
MVEHPKHVVRLTSMPTEREAAVIIAALEECGITSTMSGQFTAGFRAEAPGWVQILVAEEDVARAKEALANVRDEQRDIDWSQVDVGEPEEPADRSDASWRWPRGAIIAVGVVLALAIMLFGSWGSIVVAAALVLLLLRWVYSLLR